MAAYTHTLSSGDEAIIILTTIGGTMAILLIISIFAHLVYTLRRLNTHPESFSKERVAFMLSKQGKAIMIMTFVTLALYFSSVVSQVFLRSSAMSGSSPSPGALCTLSWFIAHFGNVFAKSMIWTTFLYRLYVSFRSLWQPVCTLCSLWLIIFALSASMLNLMVSNNPMESMSTPSGSLTFCGLVAAHSEEWPEGLEQLNVLIVFVELVMNVYIIWAFVSRLRTIRKALIKQFLSDAPRHIASQTISESMQSLASFTSNVSSSTKNSLTRIMSLSRLIKKLTFLVSLSMVSSWLYWGVLLVYPFAQLLYVFDVMVNVMCLYFVLSINAQKWNTAVYICYYPCCCHLLCPTIKEVTIAPKVRDTIVLSTTSTKPNDPALPESPEHDSDDDDNDATIEAMEGFVVNGAEAKSVQFLGGSRVRLHGRLQQTRTMAGFFVGDVGRISPSRAWPAKEAKCTVQATANGKEFNVTVRVSARGLMSAEPAFPFNRDSIAHLKHSGTKKEEWVMELGGISYETRKVPDALTITPVVSASASPEPAPVTPYSPHRDTMDNIITEHRFTIQKGLGTPEPPLKAQQGGLVMAPDQQTLKRFAE